ncbi:hypothetical protein PMAYCL1PPCAC_05653, partial [Pristionchus mayeri]
FGSIAFERYIATRFWRWYERREPSVAIVLIAIEIVANIVSMSNVLLCVNGYYPHEANLVVFAVIMMISFAIFAYAYLQNLKLFKSITSFSKQYSVARIFQMKENMRVLKVCLSFKHSNNSMF